MSRLPVLVISRDATETQARRAFEEALLGALRSRGVRPLEAPHVYHLDASHPLIEAMDTSSGLVVGAWMAPRATLWTLRALGVGQEAVECLDLEAFESPEACAEALLAAGGGRFAPAPEAGSPPEPVRSRWYPVLDRSRCRNCAKCLDFCLFGVYSMQDGFVAVSTPDNCKDGCPACARTCPHDAIMFPDYADPAIAGATPQPAARPRATPAGDPDDLDNLISALEKLDE